MGKAFNRLEKQVQGRTGLRTRYVPFPVRMLEVEKFLLELGSYLSTVVATDPDSPGDAALVSAYTEYKKHLEGTVK